MKEAKISITRKNSNSEDDNIRIVVYDVDADIEFLELEIDPREFSLALTGLSMVRCLMETMGLNNVGKTIERDTITFKMPECSYKDRKEIAYKAAQEAAPYGWYVSNYFGSKDSFFTKDGEAYGRTSITRWVEKDA